jgi:hypothetical protein
MSSTYFELLRDETLRIEVGSTAAADLAVENVQLSTEDISRAVRRSVLVRRADAPRLSANLLTMEDVRLPALVAPVLQPCAA